jgi:glycosyltransferase involved in cell wall biosynthesis
MCRPGDAADLADQIARLMEDDDLCREVGTRSMEVSRQEYSPDVHLSRLEAAYARCSPRASFRSS